MSFAVAACHNALQREDAYGGRFLFYPVFAAIGAICYFSLDLEPLWSEILVFCAICCGILYLCRHNRTCFIVAGFLLWFGLGVVFGKAEMSRLDTPMLGSDVVTTLSARIIRFEEDAKGRFRLLLAVETTERPFLKYPPKHVFLFSRVIPEGLKSGDSIKGVVRLRAQSGPIRPESYDFSFHNYFRGIGAQGFFMSKPQKVVSQNTISLWQKSEIMVAKLRSLMTKHIKMAILGEEGAIAAALITGQRGGISDATNDALRIAGLSHILSISGLHMAMVSGMVLLVMRSCFAFFPVFASRFSGKKWAASTALFIAAFYLMLSGADVAAQRSFVMVAVMLIAILVNRAAITMRNLAIATLITVIFVPHEVLGPSFQMSFAATGALVAAFSWWTRREKPAKTTAKFVGHGMWRIVVVPVFSTAIASLVAGFASGIYSAFHFSNTAPLGILSNAIAFPVMSVLVMPFALLAVLLMPFGLEWWPLQIMAYGIRMVDHIAYGIAALSPDMNPGRIPEIALVFLSLGLIILILLRTRLRFFGVVLLMIGIGFTVFQQKPLVVISEDAKYVAALLPNGTMNGIMALNREKMSAFTLNNWQASYVPKTMTYPAKDGDERQGFICDINQCHVRFLDDRLLMIVHGRSALQDACAKADMLLLTYEGAQQDCPQEINGKEKVVVTMRDLALYGAAEIEPSLKVKWASGPPERPWNFQRRYQRQARW